MYVRKLISWPIESSMSVAEKKRRLNEADGILRYHGLIPLYSMGYPCDYQRAMCLEVTWEVDNGQEPKS